MIGSSQSRIVSRIGRLSGKFQNISKQRQSFTTSVSRRVTQHSLPASYYRGGTSRAIIFRTEDLPKDRTQWDSIFLGAIGSPDPNGRQLDGMGGGISSLSKICVIGPSAKADVDYTFVALGVKNTEVDYSSNCGNMTSAVGPFAVDSGLYKVDPDSTSATISIHNTNTGKIINSTFPVQDSESVYRGNYAIDGVGGEAARVQLDFMDPAGSKTGKLLPTGKPVDEFDGIRTSCVDVGNPCCFVQAAELDVNGQITPDQIDAHPTLLTRLDSIRRQAGVKMGLAESTDKVPGSVPKICMVSPAAEGSDLVVRALSVGQPHRAVPITVALAVATASKIPGTVVSECVSETPVDPAGITITHASGKLMVGAKFEDSGKLEYATVFRTARRLMEGKVFWK